MLLKEFLEPLRATQKDLAKHLGWTYARLNEIVNGKRGVSADSALGKQRLPKTWRFDLLNIGKFHPKCEGKRQAALALLDPPARCAGLIQPTA